MNSSATGKDITGGEDCSDGGKEESNSGTECDLDVELEIGGLSDVDGSVDIVVSTSW